MLAVIFEVTPAAGRRDEYLDIAADLRPLLADVDGFVSIERFTSVSDNNRVLSLSFWRDEAAITAWRNTVEHRAAQSRGRAGIFEHYRIRVAEVVRDYEIEVRLEAPNDSRVVHDGW